MQHVDVDYVRPIAEMEFEKGFLEGEEILVTRRVTRAGQVVSLAQNQRIAIDNSRAQRSFVARLVLMSRGAR